MVPAAYVGVGLGAVAVAAMIVWRFASRRRSLPCPVWLRWFVEMDNPFTKTNRADAIVGHLGVTPGMTVLDVGCGPGRLTVPLARSVSPRGRVIAIDIQEGMLARAREKVVAAGLANVTFVRADVGDGKLGRELADRAVLVTVLGEIPDRERALREIFAALKPGTILSVTEIIFDPHFQSRGTVARLGRAAGFRVGEFFGTRIAFTLHLVRP